MSDDKTTGGSGNVTPWSAIILLGVLSQVFWWLMLGKPFLDLLARLIAAIEKIANM